MKLNKSKVENLGDYSISMNKCYNLLTQNDVLRTIVNELFIKYFATKK